LLSVEKIVAIDNKFMPTVGRALDAPLSFSVSLSVGAFDPKREAAGRGAVHLNVGNFSIRE